MSKKETIILFSIGFFILSIYIIAGFFCHPSADDFTYATLGRNENIVDTVLNERYRWNGRYISNFLVIFSPLNWGGLFAYKLMPLILICLIFAGNLFFFKNIIGKKHHLLSLVTTVITLSIMPDITEGIYWYTGAWTYIPGAVLFLYGISLIIRHWGKFTFYHQLFLSILFFIVSGFNEIIPLLGIITFAFCLVKNINKKELYLFLILFILFLVYIISAPGNSVRSSNFINKNQLFYSLTMSSAYTFRFIGEWLLNPAIYFWAILLMKMNFDDEDFKRFNFLKNPIVSIFILIIPTYICCFGPIWSTGLLGQYRTANLASYLFLPSLTLIIIANKQYLLSKVKSTFLFNYSFVLFLCFLVLWKNNYYLIKEFFNGEIVAFNNEMNDRYNKIKECKEKDCYVDEIKSKPKTLFVYPLENDSNHWQNKAYQLYFKSGTINKK